MARQKEVKPLKFRIFVNGRPWEEMTEQEQADYRRSAAERMGRALNDYYSLHPEEYKKI